MRVIFKKNFDKIFTKNFKVYFHKILLLYTIPINKDFVKEIFQGNLFPSNY